MCVCVCYVASSVYLMLANVGFCILTVVFNVGQ